MQTTIIIIGILFLLALPEILDDVAKAMKEWERNNSQSTDKD